MHRIDTDGNVAERFDPGDPLVPRPPTRVDHHWLNAVQEELAEAILAGGETLTKGTYTQIRKILGLGGAGPANAAPNIPRYFLGLINVTRAAGNAIEAFVTAGAATDAALKGHANEAIGVKGSTADGTGGDFSATGTGKALKVTGKADLTAATLTSFRLEVLTALPGTVSPEGTVIYVGAALKKAYISDGTAWNSLW